jgi:hypothetical protein
MDEVTKIEHLDEDMRVLMILVKPGCIDPTPEQEAAYKQTLKWPHRFHAVLWNGAGFVEVGADLKEISLRG